LADRFVRRDLSLDYSPAVLLMPFGFHLTVDTLPSGCLLDRTQDVGIPLSVSAVSGFVPAQGSPYLSIHRPARYAPLLDMAPLIRAPEGL
jgi:hypothetical protein